MAIDEAYASMGAASPPRRLSQITDKYGEVEFGEATYYEGPLDLALLHFFGPDGLNRINCAPFEEIDKKLRAHANAPSPTPALLVLPESGNLTEGNSDFKSFVMAVDGSNPTFVSRIIHGSSGEVLEKTIGLKAKTAKASGHMALGEAAYYHAGDPTSLPPSIFGLELSLREGQIEQEVVLYQLQKADREGGYNPSEHLDGLFIRVGWQDLTDMVLDTLRVNDRAEAAGDDYRAFTLALNVYNMLQDAGFSADEIKRQSPELARHVKRVTEAMRLLAVVEPADPHLN